MIYKQVYLSEFQAYNSPTLSNEGAEMLYNCLESLESDTELDPVALRCEWSEYDEEEFLSEFSDGSFPIEEIVQECIDEGSLLLHNDDYSVILINE